MTTPNARENLALLIKIIVLETIRQRHLGTPSDEIVEDILNKYSEGVDNAIQR